MPSLGEASPAPAPLLTAEQTTLHTQILRLTLAPEESRAYWEHAEVVSAARAERAFDERWFGSKSVDRVKLLLANFALRYGAYPGALHALHDWPRMDASVRRLVCHWHVQLADPIYRRFTGEFLVERRSRPSSDLTRDVVVRWVEQQAPGRWSAGTLIQFASKLLSAAAEAGLVEGTRDPRPLALPRVPDVALSYCLHLLREVQFEGSLLANPYLASVGLENDALEVRLRSLPGLQYRRMGTLDEWTWEYPSLVEWARCHHE